MRHQPNWLHPDVDISLESFGAIGVGLWLALRALPKKGLSGALDDFVDSVSACPWADGQSRRPDAELDRPRALYTPNERVRRDSTIWTTVQGVLAPIQFLVFLVSLGLVGNYLATGHGYDAATASIVVKTLVLYAIMITGSIWEKVVFGRYLFAPAFYWEDMVSMLVLALHTAYLAALLMKWGTPAQQMSLALTAYATYLFNAMQFLLKLRAARLEAPRFAPGKAM